MATLFSDDFNRADSSDLGSNWTEVDTVWSIDTNRLQNDAAPGSDPAVVSATGLGNKTTVKVTVTQVNAAGDGGPIARYDGGDLATGGSNVGECYALRFYGGNFFEITRYDTGVGATLLYTGSTLQVANGIIRLEVVGVGATVTLRPVYNGVPPGPTVFDTAAERIVTAGAAGVHSFEESGTPGGVGDYDAFLVESFVNGTRIYFPGSGTAAVSPAFDGAWEVTSSNFRRPCATFPTGTAFADSNRPTTSADPEDVLCGQFVSEPIQAQTITGTVKGQCLCRAQAAALNLNLAIVIKVVSNDGNTERGTLLALASSQQLPASGVPPDFLSTTYTNRRFLDASDNADIPLSSVTAQGWDRLVIEIGAFDRTNSTSQAQFRFGDDAAEDLPEDDSEQSDVNPWLEFSQSIRFITKMGLIRF
jgi:hypothetical protein